MQEDVEGSNRDEKQSEERDEGGGWGSWRGSGGGRVDGAARQQGLFSVISSCSPSSHWPLPSPETSMRAPQTTGA